MALCAKCDLVYIPYKGMSIASLIQPSFGLIIKATVTNSTINGVVKIYAAGSMTIAKVNPIHYICDVNNILKTNKYAYNRFWL